MSTLSAEDRAARLQQAANDYFAGRISLDAYMDAAKRYGTDWESIHHHYSRGIREDEYRKLGRQARIYGAVYALSVTGLLLWIWLA